MIQITSQKYEIQLHSTHFQFSFYILFYRHFIQELVKVFLHGLSNVGRHTWYRNVLSQKNFSTEQNYMKRKLNIQADFFHQVLDFHAKQFLRITHYIFR
jgi:hypothetical protein